MADPSLGTKQLCPECAAKFYDLGRSPAVCPKCQTSFDPQEILNARRFRGRPAPADYETEEDTENKPKIDPEAEGFEDEVDDTPEIDQTPLVEPLEIEEGDDITPTVPETDIVVDFEEVVLDDDGGDVPFLEDGDEEFADDDLDVLTDDEDGI